MRRPRIVVSALAFFVPLLPSPAAAQEVWAKLPATPTSCYDNTEPGFSKVLSEIRHELFTARDKQNLINEEVRQKAANVDPMERQQKMMAFMMKNPTEAGAFMQKVAAAGEAQAGAAERQNQAEVAFDERLRELDKRIEADLAALDPIWKKIGEYRPDVGYAGNIPMANRYVAQYNAEYEKICAKWLTSATSPYQKYLADYKRHLVDVRMANDAERERFVLQEFEMMGIPITTYKSTNELDAVIKYIDAMHAVSKWRRAVPLDPLK